MTAQPAPDAVLASEAHTVMLIEDDELIREALTDVLERSRYIVVSCGDSAEAVRRLSAGERPDLILLDLMTPHMDGWEFRVEQRYHADWADIPVIALSACTSAQARAIDADAYLAKPVESRELTDTVEQVIAARERVALEVQVREEERLLSLGALASGIAHEVNTPLTYVVGNLDLARRQVDRARVTRLPLDPDPLERLLRSAEDGAQRVAHVVRRMAQFAQPRSEAEGVFNLTELVLSTLQLVESQLKHRARLECDLRAAPRVKAHTARLGQVFLNLFLNAMYSLRSRPDAPGVVRVEMGEDEAFACVSVGYTSSRVSPGDVERVFDTHHFQKHARSSIGGSLSLSRRYVEELGGSLDAFARDGLLVLRVRLPRAPSEEAEPAEGERHAPRPRSIERTTEQDELPNVLVIDDEPAVCALIKAQLQSVCETTCAYGAREALDLLEQGTSFDLILCDVMMPELTGVDLHDALVRVRPEQARRMLFMTGGTFTDRTRRFFEQPGHELLLKPFGRDELVHAVEARLSRMARPFSH